MIIYSLSLSKKLVREKLRDEKKKTKMIFNYFSDFSVNQKIVIEISFCVCCERRNNLQEYLIDLVNLFCLKTI